MAKPQSRPINLVSASDDLCEVAPHISIEPWMLAAATATQDPPQDCVRERNWSILDLFPPKVLAQDDLLVEPFLTPFLEAINPEILKAFGRVDCFPTLMDPQRCQSNFLDALLYQYGNPFELDEGIDDNTKRRLISTLFTLYSLKGTCFGIIGAVRIIYGINVTECVEPNIQCWVLGESELDFDTFLCPTSAAERRSFRIMVDITLTDKQLDQITCIVDWMKPANTHFEGIIQPLAPGFVDHWELGLSELNLNTFLH